MAVHHVGVTLDCVDLELIKGFWSQALDLPDVEQEGDYLLLRAEAGAPRSGIRGLTLQRVPEAKSGKNRMHLDVVVDDVDVEVDRLVALGATVVGREAEPTAEELTVMGDPEGNEFCVIKARPATDHDAATDA